MPGFPGTEAVCTGNDGNRTVSRKKPPRLERLILSWTSPCWNSTSMDARVSRDEDKHVSIEMKMHCM